MVHDAEDHNHGEENDKRRVPRQHANEALRYTPEPLEERCAEMLGREFDLCQATSEAASVPANPVILGRRTEFRLRRTNGRYAPANDARVNERDARDQFAHFESQGEERVHTRELIVRLILRVSSNDDPTPP